MSKPQKNHALWSAEEIAVLRAMYPHHITHTIGTKLGRSYASVYGKAKNLGLKKSPDFFAGEASGRINKKRHLEGHGTATQFKPGHKSWNANKKGWQAGGRSVLTQFKPGKTAHNNMPLGSYRISTDKTGMPHLEQKFSVTKGAPHLRWRPVSRLVWEAANGPTPAGHIVVFKPGMRALKAEQITLDRLECITRAQNIVRNHPRTKNPELGALTQLKGAITRQVNRITKKHQQQQAKA